MIAEKYRYQNCPIPGGGYVTGFIFHPTEKDVFYLRTDIGGAYRFDRKSMHWDSLIGHVTMEDLSETFPTAIALDDKHPERLYIASGVNEHAHGRFCVSEDNGETFTYYEMPMHVHGNLNGRGTGYRLIVDKKDENVLWFASQDSGLWRSTDRGATWASLLEASSDSAIFQEKYLTLVGQTKDGKALIVGSAGATTKRTDTLRGHSLYVSYDDGKSFEELWQPEDGEVEGVKLAGLIAQRYTMDEEYLYVTYSVMGRNAYVYELGYSCDGGSVVGGKVVRYPLLADGKIGQGEDITPPVIGTHYFEKCTDLDEIALHAMGVGKAGDRLPADTKIFHEHGFSGITTVAGHPGALVVATICKLDGDCIYRSMDYGKSWECILFDLEIGEMAFRTEYMTPKYNGNHNLIHWQTDLKGNPFDANEAWFNTGTGVFRTANLLADKVVFEDWCDGIEETVHLNVYSLPAGELQVLDIVGDLGGFAFQQVDKACNTSFSDENGNRYITCINADYSDVHPECIVVTPRGNWTGKTKGGLILSKDHATTFRRLPMPWGINSKIDQVLHNLENPNVNSGWVAMSPDCQNIVWSIAHFIQLPMDQVLVSQDGGETFRVVEVYTLDGARKTEGGFKCFSDRVNSKLFYGMGDHFDFYVSQDGGRTFRELIPMISVAETVKNNVQALDLTQAINKLSQSQSQPMTKQKAKEAWTKLSDVNFAIIDTANKTEVRGNAGVEGSFYLALCEMGLWKMQYTKETNTLVLTKLSKDGDVFYRMGLGVIAKEAAYIGEKKAIYVAASIDGEYGFYRTVDEGKTYVRLNTDKQMFGQPNSIDGDSRTYGRFFIATGSRGLIYGEQE